MMDGWRRSRFIFLCTLHAQATLALEGECWAELEPDGETRSVH